MNDGPTLSLDSLRFDEAFDWFVRLREQPDSTDLLAEWLSWCKCDSRNLEAFEEVRHIWVTTGMLSVDSGARVRLGGNPVVPGERCLTPFKPTCAHLWRSVVVGAAVIVMSMAGIARLLSGAPFPSADSGNISLFVTARTEHRSFKLADGSSVEMAGDSKLQVSLREHSRDISLQQGEAFFSVAHDRARPFIVRAGALHVRAVGTRFDVRTSLDRVVVSVEEGVVVVEPSAVPTGAISKILSTFRSLAGKHPSGQLPPLNVRSGQEVVVGAPGDELQLLPIEPNAVASWREGRLRFARESLRSVLSRIRAVSGHDIELADPDLGELRFTGTVFSTGVDAWVHALPAIFPVTVHQDGARLVIVRRVERAVEPVT